MEDKTDYEQLPSRGAPLHLMIALERLRKIDPRRVLWISSVGPIRIRVHAWYGETAEENNVVASLIAAGFYPNGVDTLLSGEWHWSDGGHADSGAEMVRRNISAWLVRDGVRIDRELADALRWTTTQGTESTKQAREHNG